MLKIVIKIVAAKILFPSSLRIINVLLGIYNPFYVYVRRKKFVLNFVCSFMSCKQIIHSHEFTYVGVCGAYMLSASVFMIWYLLAIL